MSDPKFAISRLKSPAASTTGGADLAIAADGIHAVDSTRAALSAGA